MGRDVRMIQGSQGLGFTLEARDSESPTKKALDRP
jgi:hypothetical protein